MEMFSKVLEKQLYKNKKDDVVDQPSLLWRAQTSSGSADRSLWFHPPPFFMILHFLEIHHYSDASHREFTRVKKDEVPDETKRAIFSMSIITYLLACSAGRRGNLNRQASSCEPGL